MLHTLLVFAVFLALVKASEDKSKGFFFHLSDVHLDLEYTPNTDPLFRCINKTIPANDTGV